ncbi:hypothetical protein QO010_003829 [Caulobacter ginsengisoli]|uniref:DUF1579 domain-containing protein n=1 Tax=Caulobacter ginsengisoli TaxID=400775 RepID=A0ABU0IXG3_9CAUL|nr:DUF1579 domain-containing protein [Caulobacter ginsengisoli]MDQ0466036.1 hypothetical protein [Caulobacter ginsengisoli]
MRSRTLLALILSTGLMTALSAQAQPYDPPSRLKAEKEAMQPLAWMNGVWRGPSWNILPNGQKHEGTQTERIGPFLDGSIKFLEGRGYNADGTVSFNAFGFIAYEPGSKSYTLRSCAMSYCGEFPLKVTADGYVWEVPAGPGAIVRYTAVFKDGLWVETGERIVGDQPGVKVFEMDLRRVGDTDWPAAGAVPKQ